MTFKQAFVATIILTAATPVLAQGTPPKPDVPAPHADPGIVAQPKPGIAPSPKTDPGIAVPAPQTGRGAVIPPPGIYRNPAPVPK